MSTYNVCFRGEISCFLLCGYPSYLELLSLAEMQLTLLQIIAVCPSLQTFHLKNNVSTNIVCELRTARHACATKLIGVHITRKHPTA